MDEDRRRDLEPDAKDRRLEGNPRERVDRLLREARLEELLITAAELHGHYCQGLAFGVKAGAAGLSRLGSGNTGMEEIIAIVECNNCFVDGVQVTTGCSLGNNALVYKDLGKTAVTLLSRKSKAAVRIVLRPGAWQPEDPTPKQKEAAELFRRVVKEREEDPEATRRLMVLSRELSFEVIGKPEDSLFEIAEIEPEYPQFAPIVDPATCSICFLRFRSR